MDSTGSSDHITKQKYWQVALVYCAFWISDPSGNIGMVFVLYFTETVQCTAVQYIIVDSRQLPFVDDVGRSANGENAKTCVVFNDAFPRIWVMELAVDTGMGNL